MALTAGQAVRNAVAAERAAAQFYRALAALDSTLEVKTFLLDMARQLEQRAQVIEVRGRRLAGGRLPERPDMDVRKVDRARGWLVANSIPKEVALRIARENEYEAALLYDAMADFCPEPIAGFLRQLSRTEQEHAEHLGRVRL